MASGTITKAVGSYYRLRLVWSSTPNSSTNSSTVTTNLYWESLNSQASVSSSATKSATTTVNGVGRTDNFTAGLSGGQSKLIQTEKYTVAHNANGSKSVTISFSATLGLTLGGTYYGTVSNSGTAVLDTIGTSSTISLNAWTFPNNPSYTITRGSKNSYTHTVELQLSYSNNDPVIVATRTGLGEGTFTLSLTETENKAIASYLLRNLTYYSATAKIIIKTYNGSTLVGTKTSSGVTVSSPGATTGSITPSSPKISDTITIDLSGRASSDFIHLVELGTSSTYKVGTLEQKVVTGTSTTFNLNTYREELLSYLNGSTEGTVYIRVHTFYKSMESIDNVITNKIRGMIITDIVISANNPPVWRSGQITYADTNTTVTSITGSNQILVKGKSTARISIPSTARADAQDDGYIVSYSLSLGTFNQTWPAASVPTTVDIPITTLSSTTNAVLTATDNRNLSSSRYLSITIRDYYNPTMSTKTGSRSSSDSTAVVLSIGGYFSIVSGANSITSAKWGTSSGSYPNTMTHSFNASNGLWQATANTTLADENTQTYYFSVTDKFNTVVTGSVNISKTSPILFIDSVNASVGIGKVPDSGVALDVKGIMKTVGSGNVMQNEMSHGSTPILRVKGYSDSALLAVDSFQANYSSRISLQALGSEYGYLERYWSNNEIRLHSVGSLRLSGNEINLASETVAQNNFSVLGDTHLYRTTFDGEVTMNNSTTINATLTLAKLAGKAIQRMQVSVTPTSVNTAASKVITWPTAFNSPPTVLVMPQTTLPHTTWAAASSISSTGCTLYLTRTNSTTAVTLHVVAIES